MQRFKCGDTVKRIKDSWRGMKIGDEATIIEIVNGDLKLKEFPGLHCPRNLIKIKQFKELEIHKEER